MTAQQYVDQEIAHHERLLAAKLDLGDTEALTVHVRALIRLREIRATQYRPRLLVPTRLQDVPVEHLAEVGHALAVEWSEGLLTPEEQADEAYRHRLQLERTLPYMETPTPATSPIFALTAQHLGIDPSRSS